MYGLVCENCLIFYELCNFSQIVWSDAIECDCELLYHHIISGGLELKIMAAWLLVKLTGHTGGTTAQKFKLILIWINVASQLDQQDRSLTGQIPDKTRHRLMTCYFQPCNYSVMTGFLVTAISFSSTFFQFWHTGTGTCNVQL